MKALPIIVLLLTAAVPAFGQLYQPVNVGRTSAVTGGALTPDFSGIWARFSFPGFEPPLEGPGPITNRLRAVNPNQYWFVGNPSGWALESASVSWGQGGVRVLNSLGTANMLTMGRGTIKSASTERQRSTL
jgi:hypothetical protein